MVYDVLYKIKNYRVVFDSDYGEFHIATGKSNEKIKDTKYFRTLKGAINAANKLAKAKK